MFNKMMTGGACAPGDQVQGMNQNAFTQMTDQMIMGDAQAQ